MCAVLVRSTQTRTPAFKQVGRTGSDHPTCGLAGAGLSLYLLLRGDDDRQGASRERVARLDARVDRLEGRVGRASDETDVSRLTDQLAGNADTESQALSDEVQQLKASVDDASSGDDTSAAQQVEDLSSRSAP